jgi:hypothetical protein
MIWKLGGKANDNDRTILMVAVNAARRAVTLRTASALMLMVAVRAVSWSSVVALAARLRRGEVDQD